MNADDELNKTLHHIDTRVTVIEAEINALTGTNKWIRGIALVLIIQLIGAVAAFTRLTEQVDQLHIDELETNVNIALQVLADHGTEIEGIRNEDARLRGVIDAIRADITSRTFDRFTGRDGDRLRERLQRIEDIIYAQE